MSRGFFGIGIYHTKNELNVGTLWRTANILGADFIYTIGRRYKRQASDTPKTPRHVPLYHYQDFDDFLEHLPYGCPITAIEMCDQASSLGAFRHPERTAYLLGAEDHGLPPDILDGCHYFVRLHGERSLNVAVAGSIVLHDRVLQVGR